MQCNGDLGHGVENSDSTIQVQGSIHFGVRTFASSVCQGRRLPAARDHFRNPDFPNGSVVFLFPVPPLSSLGPLPKKSFIQYCTDIQ